MSDLDVINGVKQYLLREFLPGEDPDELTEHTPLGGGVLDSVATLQLVDFLEDTYAIKFAAHEVGVARLNTLRDIANLVASKQGV